MYNFCCFNYLLVCSFWVHPWWDSLCFLDLGDYFIPQVREIFTYLLKFTQIFYLSLLLVDPYNANINVLDVVLEVS